MVDSSPGGTVEGSSCLDMAWFQTIRGHAIAQWETVMQLPRSGGTRLRGSGGRQGDHEFGAFAGFAFHSYRAAMGFHEFPHDRQADSRASSGPAS